MPRNTFPILSHFQKQTCRGVLIKRRSENMQHSYSKSIAVYIVNILKKEWHVITFPYCRIFITEVFLLKGVLKIYNKVPGEHPFPSVIYRNPTSTWVFSYKFAAYFQNAFFKEHLWTAASTFLFSDPSRLLNLRYVSNLTILLDKNSISFFRSSQI